MCIRDRSDRVRDSQGYIDEYRQALALAQGMTPAQAEQFAATDFPLSLIHI